MRRKKSGLPKWVTMERVGDRTYVYFRRPGHKKFRMEGEPGSDEWELLYRRLVAGQMIIPAVVDEGPRPADPGTFKWLCERYYEYTEFQLLEDSTKHVRKLILESIFDEPVDEKKPDGRKFADMPFASFVGKTVRVIRDRKKDLPESANGRVKALRQVFTFAIDDEHMDKNPARDIAYLKSNNPTGFHTWTIEEVEQYEARHPIGSKARLALAILLYTAQRRGDVVLFGKQHVSGGWLRFTQEKNKRKQANYLEIPIRPELQAILDASPLGDMVWLHNDLGRPFTANGFGNKMREWCNQADLPHCTAHGLRKAACTRLADNGATAYEIMAISGHKTLKEVQRYTRAADQKRLAASASKLGSR